MSDTDTDGTDRVKGHCPNCGSRSLFVGTGGYVTCSVIGCSDPSAPSKALGVEFPTTDNDRSDGGKP